jgi:hypothetical protein
MNGFLKSEEQESIFFGYLIIDCVVVNRKKIALLLVKESDTGKENAKMRVVELLIENSLVQRVKSFDFKAHPTMRLAVDSDRNDIVGVSNYHLVYEFVDDKFQLANSPNIFLNRPKKLHGKLYCTTDNGLAVKDGQRWKIFQAFKMPSIEETFDAFGDLPVYEDIAALDSSKIIIVSNLADVQIFDGSEFSKVEFPSNSSLKTVTCSDDGYIFITTNQNELFVGDAKRWKKIDIELNESLPFKSAVWYQGKLWLTNDYSVYTFSNNKFDRLTLPDNLEVCAGNVSVADGLLLLAGLNGAAYLQNGVWTEVIT